jgi:cyclopentanol dehydrogenase
MTTGRLQNQVAIVTGGAGGIGAATCRQIAAAGAIVVVTDISDAAGEAVAGGIRAAGQRAVYQRLDVTEEGSWRALRARVLSDFGVPSVLVNNAGIDVVRSTFDTTPEQWDRIFAVNMKGMYLGVRTLAKDMHEAAVRDNRHSSVVNMSSICGMIGVAFQGPWTPRSLHSA